ncbi:MAG TPA: twin-arginine translocase subunit TatC [Thermoanaerobaculia bacterium]|nr:twin-arginine translocase subunit TatC [Thermoanaerobaculia bacterium]
MSPAPERLDPASTSDDLADNLAKMSLLDHLEELRKRLLWSIISLVAAFIPCWFYVDEIFAFLQLPILKLLPAGKRLGYTGLTEPFILYFKVAAMAAVFAASPLILFQFWRFIAPGLYKHERRYLMPFLFFGSFFFLAGGAFAYYIAFPLAAEFLLEVGKDFEANLMIKPYFQLLLTIILGLGLMFELPIVIFVLSAVGLVTPRFLLRNFRWAVVIIFVVAAIITPTSDILNLCVFAIPAILLYLLGIGAAALVPRRKTGQP